MKSSKLLWAASTAVLSFAALSQPAMAQDVGGSELEEIVVTARKVAENLQDIPVSVTAYSGEQLQQQSAVKIQDVARLTPSLRMGESASNASALTIGIRGQVQGDVLATLDPSVGTYVDGVYWSRAYGLNADLLDVQSVQVLKGPQGTLFGRNTTGGAMIFQTNDPSYSGVSGMLQGTYGSFDEMIATAVLNVPLVTDKLAIRAAVQKNQRDGTIREFNRGMDINDRDNLAARLKIRANPTDNFEVLLSAETFDMDAVSPVRQLGYVYPISVAAALPSGQTLNPVLAATNPAAFGAALAGQSAIGLPLINGYLNGTTYGGSGPDPDQVALDRLPQTKAKTQTYSGTFTLDTDLATLKYIVGYRSVKSFSAIDLDGSPFPIHYTEGSQDLDQTSHELQATGETFGGKVTFAVGGFYFTEEGVDSSLSITVPNFLPTNSLYSGTIDNKSQGVYGQATWRATDELSITGGLRYSEEEKGLLTNNRNQLRANGAISCMFSASTPGLSPAPDCGINRSDTFDGVSYTFGIDYKLTPDVLVYAKTSKGFRSGGQNLRATSSAAFVAFKPEEAVDYELGMKSEFLDRRVRFNVAVYQTNVTDIQRSTIVVDPVSNVNTTIAGNAGEIRIRGVEADLSALITEEFQIAATAALTDQKYLDYNDGVRDRRSDRIGGSPDQTFTLSGIWTKDLPFGELSVRADWAYASETASDPYNDPTNPLNPIIIAQTTTPAGSSLNARASVKLPDEHWELAAFVRNLTDNRDRNGALMVAAPIGYVSETYRDPRTFGVTATYRFGD